MMKMNLIDKQLFSLALFLVLVFISGDNGHPRGVEFKELKFCGKIYSTNSPQIVQNNFTVSSSGEYNYILFILARNTPLTTS